MFSRRLEDAISCPTELMATFANRATRAQDWHRYDTLEEFKRQVRWVISFLKFLHETCYCYNFRQEMQQGN